MSKDANKAVAQRWADELWNRGARERVPDFHVVFDDLLADGDRVAGRWTVSGTIAASGDRTQVTGIHIYRFNDGKIAEMWSEAHSVL